MAMTYGQDPATLLGIDPIADAWQAWQVRRAVYQWGTWFEHRRDETREVPAPRRSKSMMRVPKYDERDLRQMLGITAGTDAAFAAPDAASDKDAADLLATIARGGMDWAAWTSGAGE